MGGFAGELSNGARIRIFSGEFRDLVDRFPFRFPAPSYRHSRGQMDNPRPPRPEPPKMELPFISEADIQDKSKASWFSKTLASIQILWFTLQLTGRAAQHLPAAPLETFTLAIVACTVISYALWWKKPLDVDTPMIIKDAAIDYYFQTCSEYSRHIGCEHRNDVDALVDRRKENLSPLTLWHRDHALFMSTVSLVFGACHILAWNWVFPTPVEQLLWRVASVGSAVMPILFCVLLWLIGPSGEGRVRPSQSRTVRQLDKTEFSFIYLVAIVPYFLCRMYLIVEIFASL